VKEWLENLNSDIAYLGGLDAKRQKDEVQEERVQAKGKEVENTS